MFCGFFFYSFSKLTLEKYPESEFIFHAQVALGEGGGRGPQTAYTKPTYALFQNYPNPFGSGTTIRYQLPKTGKVTIGIYNLLGERIATLVDEQQKAGHYNAYWNGKDDRGNRIASGIYFCRMDVRTESGKCDFAGTRKLVMFR